MALTFGSAGYMAPEFEFLLDEKDRPSGDVYSLGVTLYEPPNAEEIWKDVIHSKKSLIKRLSKESRFVKPTSIDMSLNLVFVMHC